MKITKENYSQSPWRLLSDDGRQITYTKHTEKGVHLFHPVCGPTKASVVAIALSEFERVWTENKRLSALCGAA